MFARRQRLARRLRSDLAENRLQCLNAGRERIPIGAYRVGQWPRERGGLKLHDLIDESVN